MAHVVTDLDTTASPEQVLAALTDFSPRRFELWSNIDRDYFALGAIGQQSAEVTEGSPVFGGVWERGRYDWSRPDTVRIDVQDSNAFKPGSFWIYQVTPGQNGGSHVHMEFERRPRNFKGLLVGALLSLFGKKIFSKSLSDTLRKIESPEQVPPPEGQRSA
jgi:Polyketide cyclase / dehydrase and lipid transport